MSKQAAALFVLDRIQESLDQANRCLVAAPFSGSCREGRMRIFVLRGEWADAEQEARRMIAAAPTSPSPYVSLAQAQAALGAAPATIELTLKRRLAFSKDRAKDEAWDRVRLLLLEGDFKSSAQNLEKMLIAAKQGPELADFMSIANLLAAIYDETGQKPALLATARKMRETAEALTPNDLSWSSLEDARWWPTLIEYENGKATAADLGKAREAAWKASTRTNESTFVKSMTWAYLFADWAQSRAEAQAAIDHFADGGIDPAKPEGTVTNCPVGHVYLVAGRAADAMGLLESCERTRSPFSNIFSAMQAKADLAKAYAATGLHTQARATCQSVLDRWGRAKPISKTAQECRTLLAKLPKEAAPRRP
jgi:serine/threonine-protein kinase